MKIGDFEFLIGCDPEVFVRKKGAKRFFTSAHGLVPGNKDNPFRVQAGAVQVDGMALEFNIDPARNVEEFVNNIRTVMAQMEAMIPSDLEIVATPVAHFTKKHMAAQPEEAVELGCNPDFSAWNGGLANPRPNGNVSFRTGAGHIHIGWTQDQDPQDPAHLQACMALVKALDHTVGALSTRFDKGWKRRKLYGSIGAFRPKPYGVEYRVLSNAWLMSEASQRWVYDTVMKTIEGLVRGRVSRTFVNNYPCYWAREALSSKEGLGHIPFDLVGMGLTIPKEGFV